MSEQRKVTIEYRGHTFVVKGAYYKGSPERQYLKNGDPGRPAEAPEFDIHSILLDGTNDMSEFFEDLYNRTGNKKSASDFTGCYEEIQALCLEACRSAP